MAFHGWATWASSVRRCDVHVRAVSWFRLLTTFRNPAPVDKSGQIIATSHDHGPPNGGLVREIPLFQGNLGW